MKNQKTIEETVELFAALDASPEYDQLINNLLHASEGGCHSAEFQSQWLKVQGFIDNFKVLNQ